MPHGEKHSRNGIICWVVNVLTTGAAPPGLLQTSFIPEIVCALITMKLKVPADSVLRQWGFEIFCIVMAIGVLVAMAVVMSVFDSQPVFDGPLVTLNAIISTLSTASRVSLLAMFASTISQWNWLLFSGKNRRLLDFEHLAEASRGPLGSLKVLLNSHIAEGYNSHFVVSKLNRRISC